MVDRGHLDAEEATVMAAEAASFREVVGAIALSHNLINMEQLDHILSCLGKDKRFGEAALELGYLTEPLLEALLAIQEMQEAMEFGESLIVRSMMSRAKMLAEWDAVVREVHRRGLDLTLPPSEFEETT